jgi:hypothetical protein
MKEWTSSFAKIKTTAQIKEGRCENQIGHKNLLTASSKPLVAQFPMQIYLSTSSLWVLKRKIVPIGGPSK